MSPVVESTVEQERQEGDFRFKHVSVRVHAESLAFHGSAQEEASKVTIIILVNNIRYVMSYCKHLGELHAEQTV